MTQAQVDQKTGEAMALRLARSRAEKIVEWLRPQCERIEVAGSIRRGRLVCNDIDLVAISKIKEEKDLLGQVVHWEPALHKFLDEYVESKKGEVSWVTHGPEVLCLNLPRCQLDIWCASARTWGSLWLCRTGSKEHNVWICQRAERMGMHWQPHKGLMRNGAVVCGDSEEKIYAELELEWIAPEKRELQFLRRL